jgi:hypothetical protein
MKRERQRRDEEALVMVASEASEEEAGGAGAAKRWRREREARGAQRGLFGNEGRTRMCVCALKQRRRPAACLCRLTSAGAATADSRLAKARVPFFCFSMRVCMRRMRARARERASAAMLFFSFLLLCVVRAGQQRRARAVRGGPPSPPLPAAACCCPPHTSHHNARALEPFLRRGRGRRVSKQLSAER